MNLFTKKHSFIIKGIAILFMIIHHTLISDFYVNPSPILSNWWVIHLSMGMKMCVGIYTFIIGYAYACTKNKTYTYSFSRIWKVLKVYWLITLLFFVPIIFISGEKIEFLDVFYGAFGLIPNLNCSSWFVYFYIYSMLLFPVIHTFLDKAPYISTGIIILCFAILATLYQGADSIFGKVLYNCCFYTPILAVGYLFKVRENLFNFLYNVQYKKILLWTILLLRCFCVQIKGFSMDIVLVPLFIAFSVAVMDTYNMERIKSIFYRLGELSLYMWFIHSIFFSSSTKSWLQNSFWFTSNPMFILIFVVVLSFYISKLCRLILSRQSN